MKVHMLVVHLEVFVMVKHMTVVHKEDMIVVYRRNVEEVRNHMEVTKVDMLVVHISMNLMVMAFVCMSIIMLFVGFFVEFVW